MINQKVKSKKGYIESLFDIFSYKNLGSVRTVIDKEQNKWFCLADVCDILGIVNSRDLNKRIPQAYVDTIYTGINTALKADGTPVLQNIPLTFVNEAGLYLAIGNSRKPEAKEFMVWVFGEVLPTLNKKGYYIMDNKPKDEVIEELQREIYDIKNTIQYVDNINKVYNETIINYARKNNYILNPKLIRLLERKTILEAKRWNESYDELPQKMYGEGYTTFRFNTVEYIFKHYYDVFKKKSEESDYDEDGE